MVVKKVLRNFQVWFFFFSILSIYTVVWPEEKAQTVRGGLELESFRINPPRITRLKFLPQWLCAEMEVISLPEFMDNSPFFHLAAACPCLP